MLTASPAAIGRLKRSSPCRSRNVMCGCMVMMVSWDRLNQVANYR
jgi:hypothetical protein